MRDTFCYRYQISRNTEVIREPQRIKKGYDTWFNSNFILSFMELLAHTNDSTYV